MTNPRDSLQDLLLLEEQEGSVNFKFGVIYAREGQTTDDEMLSNGKTPAVNTRGWRRGIKR